MHNVIVDDLYTAQIVRYCPLHLIQTSVQRIGA